MRHQDYEELISRMIDNDIDENEKNLLNEHLLSCGKCGSLKKEFESLSSLMQIGETSCFKPKINNIFFNISKIAAIFILVLTISLIFINLNNKTPEVASFSENYPPSNNINEYSEKEIFSVLSSYSDEEFDSEESRLDYSPFFVYFSYLDSAE